MALIDFEDLTEPVTAGLPCGADLEVDGDPGYMNLMARIEGLLPESYFTFERGTIDFKTEIEALRRLLSETRDLRILAFLAKLLVLDRNLGDFSRCVAAIADLLEGRWSSVHPAIGDADAGMRSAVLQTLDDMPDVILPLQYMPLAQGRRSGAVSFRAQMILTGEVPRREQDPMQDATAVEQALMEGDLPALIVTRDHVARLRAAVGRIQSTWIANAGFADTPSLDRLTQLSEKILSFLDGAVAKRDPAAALGGAATEDEDSGSADPDMVAATSGSASSAPPRIRSTADAAEALAGVARFLARYEPSNPALLLVRQAEQLVGKTFLEIMTILVPDVVRDARINVGHDQPVAFPIERLSSVMPEPNGETGEDMASSPEVGLPITTRSDAMARLEQVAGFYRAAEPSSPIPLLMDRARSFASRDFMSLLREFSPDRR